jgi:hypothetical protein
MLFPDLIKEYSIDEIRMQCWATPAAATAIVMGSMMKGRGRECHVIRVDVIE